jgi:hypothetical protein
MAIITTHTCSLAGKDLILERGLKHSPFLELGLPRREEPNPRKGIETASSGHLPLSLCHQGPSPEGPNPRKGIETYTLLALSCSIQLCRKEPNPR